jgi:hypothetical protein
MRILSLTCAPSRRRTGRQPRLARRRTFYEEEIMMKQFLLAAGVVGSLAFTPARLEPHPHINGAITELVEARKELQTAAHDFGGHRVDAIRAVDAAIKQLRLARQYDPK